MWDSKLPWHQTRAILPFLSACWCIYASTETAKMDRYKWNIVNQHGNLPSCTPGKILHSLQVWSYQWVMVDGLRCLPQSHSHEHVARVQQNPFLQQDTGHTKDQASRPPALLAGHADILDMCIYGKHLHVHIQWCHIVWIQSGTSIALYQARLASNHA